MADTYTQLYVQIIFVVKGRANVISENHREELEKYITGIIQNKKSKMISIYCNPDHSHVFVSMDPSISVSEMAKLIKSNSSRFINEKKWFPGVFHWQEGFGAFTYAKSQQNKVVKYILNQPLHHKTKTFKEEYIEFLKKYEILYNEQYLFEEV